MYSCELLSVHLDAGGLVPSHLDALLTARQAAGKPMPKLLYTIPTGALGHVQDGWHCLMGLVLCSANGAYACGLWHAEARIQL